MACVTSTSSTTRCDPLGVSYQRRLAFGLACLLPIVASAQTAPILKIIVPQPAGNPTDGHARRLQPVVQRLLDQTVIVENVPGAAGSMGVGRILTSRTSDLLIASQTESILTPLLVLGARYKTADLRMVGMTTRGPYVLAAGPSGPDSLRALLDRASRPGAAPVAIGHGGRGSMIHLLAEKLARGGAVEMTLVPYKGTPAIVQDLMAGQIDIAFLPSGGGTSSQVASGQLRAYGVTARAPMHRLPAVLPLGDLLPRLGPFEHDTWGGFFVARSAPDTFVKRIHEVLGQAVSGPDFQEFVRTGGSDPVMAMTLPELDEFLLAEAKRYQRLIQQLDLKPE